MSSRSKLDEEQLERLAKIDPDVLALMRTQSLGKIVGLMEELVEGQNALRSDFEAFLESELWTRYEIPVTGVLIELEPPNIPTMPWTKFTIFNDGPDDLYMAVNEDLNNHTAPLRAGESLPVDKKKPQIRIVNLQCIAGETTTVRIFAQK